MITLGNKQICEYCLEENCGEPCRFCGFDKASFKKDIGILPPGSVLSGRYIVGRIIGQGGFGITYLAYDIALEKKIALKEYYPITYASRCADGYTVAVTRMEDADIYKNGMEKFYEEASLVSKFNGNPNMVSVYEFFYENGTAYYAMELLRGVTLKTYITEHGCLSPEQALYIADRISNALMVAHSTNTLHRDVSPDNIMLCDDGNIKLIDFGAARQVAADNPKSMSVILKQGFAPLEQYQRRGNQGPWTDLYSLGATLYYTVTGGCPDDPMTRLENDSDFQSNKHEIEPQLWELINHSLSIKIDDRYKDAIEFRAALNKIAYKPQAINFSIPESVPVMVPQAAPQLVPQPAEYTPPLPSEPAAMPMGYVPPAQQCQVVPAAKKPLNKKLIAILSSVMGVVIIATVTVLIVTLGKKNKVDTKPDDTYQQSSNVLSNNPNPTSEPANSSTNPPTSSPTNDGNTPFSHGSWSGNTYTSNFLGIKIYTGSDWTATSEADLAASCGISDMSENSIRAALDRGSNIMEMMTSSGDGTSINITVQDHEKSQAPSNKDEYFRLMSSAVEDQYKALGYDCEISRSTVDFLGGRADCIEVKVNIGNGIDSIYQMQLPIFKDQYLASITFSSFSKQEIYSLLGSITTLDAPPPTPSTSSAPNSAPNAPDGNAPTEVTIRGISYPVDITELKLSFNSLTDIELANFKYFTNLKTLDLSYNNLTDLSALSSLTTLETLTITANDVSDLSFISGMKNLTKLVASFCEITDISPLKNCTALTDIDLSGNSIKDLSPLHSCTGIRYLHLCNNKTTDEKTLLASFEGLRMIKYSWLYFYTLDDNDPGYVFPSKADAIACRDKILAKTGETFNFSTQWYENGKIVRDFF